MVQELKIHLKHSMSGFSMKNDLKKGFVTKNEFNIAAQLSVQEFLKSFAGKIVPRALTTGKRSKTKSQLTN